MLTEALCGAFKHLCPPVFTLRLKSAWVCWKLVSLHLARSCRQVLLRAFLLLHFLPLFAQRFGAIIGTTARHYSYVSTHSSTKGTSVCQRPTPSRRDLPSCSTTANTQLLPQPGAWRCAPLRVWVFFFCFCQVTGGPSQLAASLKGPTRRRGETHRWVPPSLNKLPQTHTPPLKGPEQTPKPFRNHTITTKQCTVTPPPSPLICTFKWLASITVIPVKWAK